VSNVLNRPGEVSPEAVVRVQAAITELGYIRNPAARQLRAGVSATVGFVVLNGQNPFFNDVVRGAEDEATRNGIAILFGNTDEDPRRESLYLDLFEEQSVRGVLITPSGDIQDRLGRLRERGIAAVLVDRHGGPSQFSSVSVDSVAGGRLAAQHLIDTGRRHIAFVGGPFSLRQVDDRLEGARSAAEQSGVDVQLEVLFTETLTVKAGREAGERMLQKPLYEMPDAVFAANDLLALGILQALVADGRLVVPRDISLIGFDDIAFAEAAAVPLSSMRQPSRDIGRTALRILLEEVEEPTLPPRQTVYIPQLIARASTRR
jgi:LacI family transcriptional regulator